MLLLFYNLKFEIEFKNITLKILCHECLNGVNSTFNSHELHVHFWKHVKVRSRTSVTSLTCWESATDRQFVDKKVTLLLWHFTLRACSALVASRGLSPHCCPGVKPMSKGTVRYRNMEASRTVQDHHPSLLKAVNYPTLTREISLGIPTSAKTLSYYYDSDSYIYTQQRP